MTPRKANPLPGGAPTKLTEKMIEAVLFCASKGFTDEDIAKASGVAIHTIYNWKNANPEFLQALKAAKASTDDLVQASLLGRALGYDYKEESATKDGPVECMKKMHGDVTACIFWLKNRRPKEWREKTDLIPSDTDNMRTLNKIFVTVRERETLAIRSGQDQLDVLFGKDNVLKLKNAKPKAKSKPRV